MSKPDNYGVSLSLLIHALILVMPVSMVVTKHFKEVELFVLDEPMKGQKPKLIKSPPSPKQAVSEPQPMLDVEFGSPNAPAFVHREMPVYPFIARRLGKEGKVLLRLTIDENGRFLNVEVLEDAGYGFAESAVEAVKKSTFKPAMQDGKAVMSKALLPIRFSLRRD